MSERGGMDLTLKPTSTLTGLMNLATSDTIAWSPDELAAIWQHQLHASLTVDLGPLADICPGAWTFGNVVGDPAPPVELLRKIKDFAKRHTRGDAALPPEIATILYYVSIGLAMLRCDSRISELSDLALHQGFAWASEQAWLDGDCRALFLGLLNGIRI